MAIPIIGILILLFILAAISFPFFSSQTAVIGLSKIRLRHLVKFCAIFRLKNFGSRLSGIIITPSDWLR
ncbi:MAG: hypothetical protein ABIC18_02795 [Candidatus Omnitrophota bacterium]